MGFVILVIIQICISGKDFALFGVMCYSTRKENIVGYGENWL